MARISPHVVATRLTPAQLLETSAAAQARGQSVSTYTRDALARACVALLTAEGTSPEYKLAAIADLLELPAGSTVEQIVEALGALGATGADTTLPPDPLAQNPDQPITTRLTTLSAADRAALAKRGIFNDRQFAEAKSQVKRV